LKTVNDIKHEWTDYITSRETNVKKLWASFQTTTHFQQNSQKKND